jgi:UPF0489 domain
MSTTSSSARKRKRPRPIYCVVVESHQHVLEHIHTILRKERLLSQDWSMLHFDSHPDLACPQAKIPAKACFLPHETFPDGPEEKNLYELLDSTATGIAEWILPLVLAANLRQVKWVKSRFESGTLPRPPFPLPLGKHQFRVGAAVPKDDSVHVESFVDLPLSATVKVDWPHPYYLEDGCTVHYGQEDATGGNESFLFAKPVDLEVSELSPNDSGGKSLHPNHPPCNKDDRPFNRGLWSLDICLDYFVCQNPFLIDLEAKDADYTRALLTVVYESRFYGASLMSMTNESAVIQANETLLQHYQRDIRSFWSLVVTFLKAAVAEDETSCQDAWNKLLVFYTDQCQAQTLFQELTKALPIPHDGQHHPETPSILIGMTEQALPNLVMPHQSTSETGFSLESIQPSLERVCEEIERVGEASEPPFIVTMARSANDGFTPSVVADQIQRRLILFLHSHFCGCSACPLEQRLSSTDRDGNCRFQLIYDYGPWEGTVFV